MWKWLLAIAVLLLAALAWGLGLQDRLDPEHLAALLTESGAWGPLVFVLLFAGLEAFGVPGIVFMATAVAVWPPWLAFLLNWCGAVGAGLVGFAFARYVARDWVTRRLPARLAAVDARVARRGLATVIVVRLLFFLAPPAHWALGLSRVRFDALLLGSIIGLLPGIAAVSFGGSALVAWLREGSAGIWLVAGAAALALALLWRRRTRWRDSATLARASSTREGDREKAE